jgi:hypothetical protein
MITIRNPRDARAVTVIAAVDLRVGEVALLVQGDSAGEPPKVRKASAAELADATLIKGVVDFIVDNDEAVDFTRDPASVGSLALNTGDDNTVIIPAGSACVIWHGHPIIGFHSSAVDASLDFATAREGLRVAFSSVSSRLVAYNGAGDDGADVYMGTVYQNEGPELTVMLNGL